MYPAYFQSWGLQLYKHNFSHTFSSQAEAAVPAVKQLDGSCKKKSELVQKFSSSPDVWHPTNTNTGLHNPLPSLTPLECQHKLAVSRRVRSKYWERICSYHKCRWSKQQPVQSVRKARQHTQIDKERLGGKRRGLSLRVWLCEGRGSQVR